MPPVQNPIKSVIVCGHDYYGFVGAIAAGFNSLKGISATSHYHEHIAYSKARSSSFFRRLRYHGKSRRLNDQVVQTVTAKNPDLAVIIEGASVTPETVREMRTSRLVVFWALDSLRRLRPPTEQLEAYDSVFSFEPKDAEIWPNAVYLPIGFDDRVYHPLPGAQKDFDLVWIGSAHKDRLDRLNTVAGISMDLGIRFGVFGPMCKKKQQREFSARYPFLYQCIVKNKGIAPEEANRIFNGSTLAINFHSTLDKDAAYNPRTWEASAAGSIILTDWKEAMQGQVHDGENAFVYTSMDNLKQRLPKILADRNALESIRQRAESDAKTKHTFAARTRGLLDHLENEKRHV